MKRWVESVWEDYPEAWTWRWQIIWGKEKSSYQDQIYSLGSMKQQEPKLKLKGRATVKKSRAQQSFRMNVCKETCAARAADYKVAAVKLLQLCPTVWPHRWQPTRLPGPWDSPSKNTGVGCRFLLQCLKVKSESEVAQSCPTLFDPMDCSHQAPPSMGFSRQEYWSGVPLPSPTIKLEVHKLASCSKDTPSHSTVAHLHICGGLGFWMSCL